MYGLVNKAAQDFIIKNHGQETWEIIKKKANVQEEAFISMQPYPDKITYDIVLVGAEHLNLDPEDILEAFGEYWIEFTMEEGYSNLLNLAGRTFPEFLNNINNLHSHIAQSYTKLDPPTFFCKEINKNTFMFEYHSNRPGLARFVKGLLQGLGKRYEIEVHVKHQGTINNQENSHAYLVTYS